MPCAAPVMIATLPLSLPIPLSMPSVRPTGGTD